MTMDKSTTDTLKQIKDFAEIGALLTEMKRGGGSLAQSAEFLGDALKTRILASMEGDRDRIKKDSAAALELSQKRLRERGPKVWAMIHGRPFSGLVDPAVEKTWLLRAVKNGLGCHTCVSDFAKMIEEERNFEGIIEDPETYFRLTVNWHNLVNAKTAAPQMTYAAALAKWAPQS